MTNLSEMITKLGDTFNEKAGDLNSRLSGFIDDLSVVLRAFLAMAGAFAKRRLGRELWSEFLVDVDQKSAFSCRASSVWS